MPMYKVKCVCGEEFKKYISGKNADWIAENGDHICQECRDKERDSAAQEAAEKAKRQGLPALEGSEKQIKWAEQIRQKLYEERDKTIEEVLKMIPLTILEKLEFDSEAEEKEWRGKIEEVLDEIFNTKNQASYWIDRRGGLVNTILDKLV